MPAKAGIRYAETPVLNKTGAEYGDHPLSRMTDRGEIRLRARNEGVTTT